MFTDNMNAKIAGLSFIISYIGLIIGNLLLAPIINAPDYLATTYPNALQVGIGVLIESVNGIAVIGIAVMLYPILKRQNEGVALGYLVFRVVEGFLSILGSTKAAALIEISHEYIQAGSPADSIYDALGVMVLADRHWTMEMLTVFFLLGAFLFFILMYQSEILPKWVALWGFVAVALITTMNALIYTGIDLGFVFLFLALPIIANEFFVAIWLIVKGVNTSAIVAEQ